MSSGPRRTRILATGSAAVRSALPAGVRRQLYAWHPGRAGRWRAHPGLETLPAGRGVALTFDDGPDPEGTPAVLDALDSLGATATFFAVGEHVRSHPELAGEIVRRGHEIAAHGFTHVRHDRLAPDAAGAEVTRCCDVIEDVTGVRPRRFRPPFGRASAGTMDACRRAGLDLVYWSGWGHDWEDVAAAEIARVVAQDLRDGAVVLLHDSARFGRRPSAAPTAAAVGMIGAEASSRGLTLASLATALATERADGRS